MRLITGIIVCIAFILFAVPANAQTSNEVIGVVFKEIEKRLIKEYFGGPAAERPRDDGGDKGKGKDKDQAKGKDKSKQMPAGLARRDQLPPGLQKQLERNGTLPPGLAKRQLPADLKGLLPPPPKGRERIIVDNDVLLIEMATGLILDIIEDVIK